MSDNEDEQHRIYREDARIPCRYGTKCYQKNSAHHEKYKHPPTKDTNTKGTGMKCTVRNKKRKIKDRNEVPKDSPKKKMQKKDDDDDDDTVDENLHNTVSDADNMVKNDEKHETVDRESSPDDTNNVKHVTDRCTIASLLKDCNISTEDDTLSKDDVKIVISYLFLTEMPDDFYQFYEFCKSINEKDCFNALKDLHIQLVGPYDVFRDKFLNFKVESKEALLRHWRYYYDPPEFQTIVKVDGKDGLHFGYWRDEIAEKPVFVAKNKAAINGLIEAAAENIFEAIDAYIGNKLKLANPFEKTRISQLHKKLRNFVKENQIQFDKKTGNMQARERKVVARTLHKAGIVVPYNKKTELGYRNLAVTDSELRKILDQMKQASTDEGRKTPLSKLEEVIRLATIAADECDFGTCLELGHDLFTSGVSIVQTKALNMLSLAYTLLQRPQFLEIVEAHLKGRTKSLNPSVLSINN
uniref:histone PARylation factor 1 isoform X1 n=1 Tax=Osmia lignaria TaxID=473952 RepID=UPI0014792CC2|nr:histone PARylation factor 1 isoform X1 [Osmia lignaria]